MATPLRAQRALTASAVAVLAVGGAAGLGRLFLGAEPRLQLVGAAVVAVVVGALCARRSFATSAVISLVGLMLALSWIFFPASTWFGVPTPSTFRLLFGLAGRAGLEIQTQIAPTLPLGGLMIVCVSVVWIASWTSHALAERAQAPLTAAAGPLALYAFADVVLKEGSRPAFAALLLFGMVAVLFADGLGRIRRWGPLRIWEGPAHRVRWVTLRATRGAWGVAASVILIAALAPGLLPGWEEGPVLQPRSGGGADHLDPLVSIQADLTTRYPERLFIVEAPRAAYWRLLSLDTFDGTTWSTADLMATRGREITDEGTLLVPQTGAASVADEQRFEILGLGSPWLPMAADPARITLDGEVRFDPDAVVTVRDGGMDPGDRYTVVSRLPDPSPEALEAAPDIRSIETRAALPPGLYERYTQIAPLTSPRLAELAEKWTEDVDGQYRRLLAIQERFRERFTYEEEIRPPRGADALVWFLTESKEGFCQQFAGAMAGMARTLGYPARVAVGYLPGVELEEGRWTVTSSEAHAWPEIYFAGVGWIAFEPTPGRSNPVAGGYLNPAYLSPPDAKAGGQGAGRAGRPGINGIRWKARHATDTGFGELPLPEEGTPWVRPAMLVAGGVALIALLCIPPAKALSRRRRLRRARSPRELALAGFDVFAARAGDLGFGRAPGQTLTEFGRTLDERGVGTGTLLETVTQAAYRASAPSDSQARAAVHDGKQAARALARSAGLRARVAGAFRVPSRSGGPSR